MLRDSIPGAPTTNPNNKLHVKNKKYEIFTFSPHDVSRFPSHEVHCQGHIYYWKDKFRGKVLPKHGWYLRLVEIGRIGYTTYRIAMAHGSIPHKPKSNFSVTIGHLRPLTFDGDVAQLVERRLCKAEARGSSPLISTKS